MDTYRGIAYQHAQAVLSALDVVGSDDLAAIRVEGVEDVIDIELLDARGLVVVGKQAKVKADGYTWAKADLVGLLRRWAAIDVAEGASFQFVTDGRLGPSGEEVRDALAEASAGRSGPLAALLGEEADGEHPSQGCPCDSRPGLRGHGRAPRTGRPAGAGAAAFREVRDRCC